jgi:aromatic amino acid aminotransferase I
LETKLTLAYPGLLCPAATMGINCVGVPMDEDGVKPEALDQLMTNWDEGRQGRKPKMILMVPYVSSLTSLMNSTCSNPCGMTMSEQRKKDIYRLAQKWELLIVEDDPCKSASRSG